MKIYISGKITGTTDYMERFAAAEAGLTSDGYEVINPVKVNASLPRSTTHDEYMSVCYPLIDMADAVYMMQGWTASEGARIEFSYAIERGKIIVRGTSSFSEDRSVVD